MRPRRCAKVQSVNDGTQQKSGMVKKQSRFLPGLTVKDGLIRHPFDLEYGVRTSGLVAGRHLGVGHRHDRHMTAYYAVAPSVFEGILGRWRRCRPAGPIDAFSFVDLGAGMGRAVLLAAEHPFRAVVGVELHPGLARTARRNLTAWRKAGRALAPVRIQCRDAAEFALPAGPCVVFLFNPFGAAVLKRVLKSWSQQLAGREGQVDILYVNNEQEHVLEVEAGFQRLFLGPIRRSRADLEADRTILTHQPDGEYAATAWEDCSIYRWMGKA